MLMLMLMERCAGAKADGDGMEKREMGGAYVTDWHDGVVRDIGIVWATARTFLGSVFDMLVFQWYNTRISTCRSDAIVDSARTQGLNVAGATARMRLDNGIFKP